MSAKLSVHLSARLLAMGIADPKKTVLVEIERGMVHKPEPVPVHWSKATEENKHRPARPPGGYEPR